MAQFFSLSPDHAVAPQISPEDIAELADVGFTRIICNRPDMENPVELHANVLRTAAEAAGMEFADNPVMGGGMTLDHVTAQTEHMTNAPGKTLAYCASGTRSAILWALANAGTLETDDILAALRNAGYQLDGMRGQIDMLAQQK